MTNVSAMHSKAVGKDPTHLADKSVAKDILHGRGQVLVEADQLKCELSVATAHPLGGCSHAGCCHMRLHLNNMLVSGSD